jgi:uncharacterized protein (TIGR02217 family)
MTFPAYRLPPKVEEGMQGGPTYYNVIQEAISGVEQRVKVWAKCRGRWECSYPILDRDDSTGDFRAVIALFRAHFGSLYPFPFKDWTDYELTNENIGTGDGSETEFQITKTYDPSQILLGTPGSRTYVREIYLPRSGLVVKVNGVTKTLTTGSPAADYSISSTGLITFTSPPTNGHAITVTGEFDVPVRFDIEQGEPLPLRVNELNIAVIDTFTLREVIGTAELA